MPTFLPARTSLIPLQTAAIALLAWLLPVSCSTDGQDLAGPCIHENREPILHITQVTDRASGQAVRSLVLSRIMLNGLPVDAFELALQGDGVAALDSVLVVNPPCAFGVTEGSYSFVLSATGFRDTTVSVSASYSVFRGGCPSYSDGGTRVSFVLSRP